MVHRHDVLEELHLPAALVARQAQAAELRFELTFGPQKTAGHAWLHGPPGAGKTSTARFVIEALRAEAGVPVAYVNCWKANTAYLALAQAIDELRILGLDQRRDALSRLAVLSKEAARRPFVLVLDEFDALAAPDRSFLLYTLAELERVSLVCIAGSQEPLVELEDRVRSRFRPVQVAFARYAANDLVAILLARAETGLTPGSWSRSQLERIAGMSNGDARIAIQTLRRAANLADRAGEAFLTDAAVDRAYTEMRDIRKQYALRKLTPHHRLIFDLVLAEKGLSAKELWSRYLQAARSYGLPPIALRTFRKYANVELTQARLVEVRPGGPRRNVFRYYAT